MVKRVQFESGGRKLEGELSEPEGSGKVPALVLLQEYWGVNDQLRSLVDRFAKEGFLVLAPDLYHGKVTKDPGEAAKWMSELDTSHAISEIAGAIDHVAAHPRSNGKVGVVGFCMGGALTFASACHLGRKVAAAVPFYGIPPAEKVDYDKVTAPILTHVGKKDQWVTPARIAEIQAKLESRKHPIEVNLYDADHAFANDTRPEVYDPSAAKLALERTFAFFRKHLA